MAMSPTADGRSLQFHGAFKWRHDGWHGRIPDRGS